MSPNWYKLVQTGTIPNRTESWVWCRAPWAPSANKNRLYSIRQVPAKGPPFETSWSLVLRLFGNPGVVLFPRFQDALLIEFRSITPPKSLKKVTKIRRPRRAREALRFAVNFQMHFENYSKSEFGADLGRSGLQIRILRDKLYRDITSNRVSSFVKNTIV